MQRQLQRKGAVECKNKNAVLILNNDVTMPAMGLGVYHSGPEQTVDAVRTALADVFDFQLTEDDVAAIDALDTHTRGGPDPEQVDTQMFSFKIED